MKQEVPIFDGLSTEEKIDASLAVALSAFNGVIALALSSAMLGDLSDLDVKFLHETMSKPLTQPIIEGTAYIAVFQDNLDSMLAKLRDIVTNRPTPDVD